MKFKPFHEFIIGRRIFYRSQGIVLTIVLSILFISNSNAQLTYKKHQINTNLLSLKNLEYSSLTIGYEFSWSKYFGIELTYGQILPRGEWLSDSEIINKTNNRGNVLRLEPKFYLISNFANNVYSRVFFSSKIYRTYYNYTSKRMITNNDLNNIAIYEVNRINNGIIINLGFNTVSFRHIFSEFSIGVGKKYSKTKNNYNGEILDLLDTSRQTKIADELNGNQDKWRLNLNFKLGYAF